MTNSSLNHTKVETTMSNEILAELLEVFPTTNYTVPYIEMKFRLAAKYGEDKLEEVLSSLVEKGILSKFEFNNALHYKSKADIPVTMGGSANPQSKSAPSQSTISGTDQLNDLSKIVLELAKTDGNPQLADLVKKFQETYKI